ncbi:hypothetical protein PoB_005011000 [Plakobranchus ocellatus]|uniref:Uncharacterized protein n=1 Tax=Plakobranchus ocellatus TaxID=259542 RepID=A0AAV4BT44_9GAST|nr:hypothetical protein PoB_005011000 [Plakobranchus ocellatus]
MSPVFIAGIVPISDCRKRPTRAKTVCTTRKPAGLFWSFGRETSEAKQINYNYKCTKNNTEAIPENLACPKTGRDWKQSQTLHKSLREKEGTKALRRHRNPQVQRDGDWRTESCVLRSCGLRP